MHKLNDEKYAAELFGKLINISYEVSNMNITDISIFKSLVSEEDSITARKLYKEPFKFKNTAKLWMASNVLPNVRLTTKNDTDAYFNRLLIIPCEVSIPLDKQDKNLLEKLKKEFNIFFSWAMESLHEYIMNGYKFDIAEVCKDALKNYRNNMNSAQSFIMEKCSYEGGKYTYRSKLINEFENYCIKNNLKKPDAKDIKELKDILEATLNCQYKKIHRNKNNKYGYVGLEINI